MSTSRTRHNPIASCSDSLLQLCFVLDFIDNDDSIFVWMDGWASQEIKVCLDKIRWKAVCVENESRKRKKSLNVSNRSQRLVALFAG